MTKLKESLKNILNCCNIQRVFKNQTRLSNNFHFKDHIPKDLTSRVVYKFQCGLINSDVRINEYIGISQLTKKKLNLRTVPFPIIYYFATILVF